MQIEIFSQGEEIGMLNANISYEDTIDPQGCNCGPDRYESKKNICYHDWVFIIAIFSYCTT